MNTKENEAIKNVIEVVGEIKKTDDEIIKVSNNLKIILLNLKIENSRIKQNTGIDPIVSALSNNVRIIEDSVKNLVSSNREKLVSSLEILSKYISETEESHDIIQ